jgi:hypothetical protein
MEVSLDRERVALAPVGVVRQVIVMMSDNRADKAQVSSTTRLPVNHVSSDKGVPGTSPTFSTSTIGPEAKAPIFMVV